MAILKINPSEEVFVEESVSVETIEFDTDADLDLCLILKDLFIVRQGKQKRKLRVPGDMISISLKKSDIEYLAGFFNSLVSEERRCMIEFKEDQDDARSNNLISVIKGVITALYETN